MSLSFYKMNDTICKTVYRLGNGGGEARADPPRRRGRFNATGRPRRTASLTRGPPRRGCAGLRQGSLVSGRPGRGPRRPGRGPPGRGAATRHARRRGGRMSPLGLGQDLPRARRLRDVVERGSPKVALNEATFKRGRIEPRSDEAGPK